MKSQCDRILARLRCGPMTPMDALNGAGCFRLGARIYDLRRAGHKIVTEMVPYWTYGERKRVARYRLRKEKK